MFFTREDINKIYQALLKLGIKDSELPETSDVKNDDTLAIVQDGKNKQINVREFLNQISLWKREDFINVTDKYKKSHITLVEAIQAIPIVQRKEGLVITFLDTENNWRIYQFRGSLLQFNNETLWIDLYDFSPYIIDPILPDEEDITQSAIDEQGNTYLSLKDREYNPSEFSGKGYKILRKNIIEIEDENSNKVNKNILTQDMINEPNTVYEIRYDFDLNDAEITIPENCILSFKGGNIKNGVLNLNDVYLDGFISISCDIIGSVSNTDIYVKWFNPFMDGINDDSRNILKAYKLANKDNATLIFDNKIYMYGDGLKGPDGTGNSYDIMPGTTRPLQDADHPADIGREIRMTFVNKNNIKILGNGGTILCNPNNGECKNNAIFIIYNCSDILLENLKIEGNKTARKPRLSDYATGMDAWDENGEPKVNLKYTGYASRHNIFIEYGKNITLKNVTSNESLLDGICIAGDQTNIPRNIQVINCVANFCYRMGLTISSVNDSIVSGGEYSYSGYALDKKTKLGILPGAGIDVEADSYKSYNIDISNVLVQNNYYNGIVLSSRSHNVKVHNCRIINDSIYSLIDSENNKVIDNYFYNSGLYINQPNALISNNIFSFDKNLIKKNSYNIVVLNKDTKKITTFSNNIIDVNVEGIDLKAPGHYGCVTINGFINILNNTFKNMHCYKVTRFAINGIKIIGNTIINDGDQYKDLQPVGSFYPYMDNGKMIPNIDYCISNNNLVGNSNMKVSEISSNSPKQELSCGELKILLKNTSQEKIYKITNLSFVEIDVIGSTFYKIKSFYRGGYSGNNMNLYYEPTVNQNFDINNLSCTAYIKNSDVYLKLKSTYDIPNNNFAILKYTVSNIPLISSFTPEEVDASELEGAKPIVNLSKIQDSLPSLTATFNGTNIINSSNKTPYWYIDNKWVNAEGISYNIKKFGTFSNKPSSLEIPIGFSYFCTDKQTAEGNSNGIIIYYKGNNVWVDTLGRIVNEDYPILTKGSTEQRPILAIIDDGFEYYDTTLKKKILWNGTEWTSIDGTDLDTPTDEWITIE